MKFGSIVLTASLLLAACGTEPSPLPPGAAPMTVLPDYATWWQSTEACSGLKGDFKSIEWFEVPGTSTFASEAGTVVGLWTKVSGQNRITIAGDYIDNELVVRHEMLHALLSRSGHPTEYFVTRCGLTWASWGAQNGGPTPAGTAVALGGNPD
jgi:hypothetical protein